MSTTLVTLTGAIGLCLLMSSCGRSAPPSTTSLPAPPSARSLTLQIRVVDVQGSTARIDVRCYDIATSTVTLTATEAVCRLMATRAGVRGILASADVPLRRAALSDGRGRPGDASVVTSLTVEPSGEFAGTVDLALPGPGTYSIQGAMMLIPGVASAPDTAIVR